jgi:hypothetical protein
VNAEREREIVADLQRFTLPGGQALFLSALALWPVANLLVGRTTWPWWAWAGAAIVAGVPRHLDELAVRARPVVSLSLRSLVFYAVLNGIAARFVLADDPSALVLGLGAAAWAVTPFLVLFHAAVRLAESDG